MRKYRAEELVRHIFVRLWTFQYSICESNSFVNPVGNNRWCGVSKVMAALQPPNKPLTSTSTNWSLRQIDLGFYQSIDCFYNE